MRELEYRKGSKPLLCLASLWIVRASAVRIRTVINRSSLYVGISRRGLSGVRSKIARIGELTVVFVSYSVSSCVAGRRVCPSATADASRAFVPAQYGHESARSTCLMERWSAAS
jgi:hypothetical protein